MTVSHQDRDPGTVIFFLMLALAASLPLAGTVKIISILLLCLTMLVRVYRGDAGVNITIAHYGFLLLILSGALSGVYAENPGKGFKGVHDIFYYTVPFFAASGMMAGDERRVRVLFWCIYVSAAAAALLGMYHSVETHRALEIHSLGNQNHTAMYLVIVLASMISTLVFSDLETGTSRAVLGALASLVAAAAVMTSMRSSFLGLGFFLTALLLSKRKRLTAGFIPAGLLGLVVLAAFFYKPMWSKLLVTSSLFSRLEIWRHAVELFTGNPVLGVGLNNFKYTFDSGDSFFDAHSLYLQTASQMGLIGLSALSLILFGLIRKWFRLKTVSGMEAAVMYSALGGLAVTFIGGIFDTTLHHEHAIIFTLLAGLMSGIREKEVR